MVFVNKYLLSSTDLKFDAPLFITAFQCLVSFGICFILSISSSLYPNLIKFPSYKVDLKIARDVKFSNHYLNNINSVHQVYFLDSKGSTTLISFRWNDCF